jgi:hypothetical protein
MTTAWPLATDQTRCYDAQGDQVPCSGSGQDAAGGSTPGGASRRFRSQGALVEDAATGLTWTRDANPFEFPYSWPEAFALVDDMNRAAAHGITDWRLPTRRELFSLVSHQHVNPALPEGHPFENVFPGYYWTATPCARLPAQAWYVHLGGARVYRGMQNGAYLIWPVSGPRWGASTLKNRLETMESLAHDRLTGLTWTREALGGSSLLTWEAALEAASALNRQTFSGRSDWRLPNIRELESLVDLTRHSPALPHGFPWEAIAEGCWSSTTSVYEPRYAWVLYLRDGAVGVGFKPEASFHAWAVAGPQTPALAAQKR